MVLLPNELASVSPLIGGIAASPADGRSRLQARARQPSSPAAPAAGCPVAKPASPSRPLSCAPSQPWVRSSSRALSRASSRSIGPSGRRIFFLRTPRNVVHHSQQQKRIHRDTRCISQLWHFWKFPSNVYYRVRFLQIAQLGLVEWTLAEWF